MSSLCPLLEEHVQHYIFSFLSIPDLLRVSRVCISWRNGAKFALQVPCRPLKPSEIKFLMQKMNEKRMRHFLAVHDKFLMRLHGMNREAQLELVQEMFATNCLHYIPVFQIETFVVQFLLLEQHKVPMVDMFPMLFKLDNVVMAECIRLALQTNDIMKQLEKKPILLCAIMITYPGHMDALIPSNLATMLGDGYEKFCLRATTKKRSVCAIL